MPFPPPPPPPGPLPTALVSGPPAGGGSGDGRGLLLQSIRQGTKLKKVETVDKSGPLIAGKVAGTGGSSSPRGNGTPLGGGSSRGNAPSAPSGLGALFAGGIPKLKPTGRPLGENAPSSPGSVSSPSISSPPPPPPPSEGPRRIFPGDVKNRGPPPQPPPANQKPTGIATSTSDSILTDKSQRTAPVLPSKPPAGGYGKPNVAPKPPGMAPNAPANSPPSRPSPPPKKVMNGSSRPSVSRAQSMRVPRSPPVAPPTGPNFPISPSNQGELSKTGLQSFHQSQDSLHFRGTNAPPPPRTGTLPSSLCKPTAPAPPPPSGTPANRPLRPPVSKPPPPPIRPVPPHVPPPPPPNSAPPPPPHRTQNMFSSSNSSSLCSAPPPPPTRNSSMRNGTPNNLGDLEARFSFRNLKEFPQPLPFRNIVKHYNNRSGAKQQAPPPPTQPHVQLVGGSWSHNTSNC